MSTRRPHAWAETALRAITDVLPPGPVRERYRTELESELWGLGTWAQLGHVLSVLRGVLPLHRVLVETGALDLPHTTLWCRLRLHHDYRPAATADGDRYRRCRACGTDDDGTLHAGRSSGYGIAMHSPVQY